MSAAAPARVIEIQQADPLAKLIPLVLDGLPSETSRRSNRSRFRSAMPASKRRNVGRSK
jgi:hypothetical protein